MRALLVRVGADQSDGGGNWNGPVDCLTGQFAYVPIPESKAVREGHERPYAGLVESLTDFDQVLPSNLANRLMHLDPDFMHLSYGDHNRRAQQIRALEIGDYLIFYAGLKDITSRKLVYGLIGLLKIEVFVRAADVPEAEWAQNAHTRRLLNPAAEDLVVRGDPSHSGRLVRCIPVGEYRDRAYRVRQDVLDAWGGVSSKDGYLQRSASLPKLTDASRFLSWFKGQNVDLVREN